MEKKTVKIVGETPPHVEGMHRIIAGGLVTYLPDPMERWTDPDSKAARMARMDASAPQTVAPERSAVVTHRAAKNAVAAKRGEL